MNQPEEKLSAYLSKVALAITAISVLTFAIGCYIINTNLATYQILDFDLVKPRAVITGFVYLLLLCTNVSLYLIVPFNLVKSESEKAKHIPYSYLKYLLVSFSMFYFIDYDVATSNYCVFNFMGFKIDLKTYVWLAFYLLVIIELFLHLKKTKIAFSKVITTLATIATTYLFLLYCRITTFLVILALQFLILVITTVYYEVIIGARDREIKNLGKIPMDEMLGLKEMPLYKLGEEAKKITLEFRKKHFIISRWAFSFFGIVAFLFITAVYSRMFYPKFSQPFGGGKLEPIAYVIANDTIIGKKVYETENFVFVLNPDTSITKLDWKDIKKILKRVND